MVIAEPMYHQNGEFASHFVNLQMHEKSHKTYRMLRRVFMQYPTVVFVCGINIAPECVQADLAATPTNKHFRCTTYFQHDLQDFQAECCVVTAQSQIFGSTRERGE